MNFIKLVKFDDEKQAKAEKTTCSTAENVEHKEYEGLKNQ